MTTIFEYRPERAHARGYPTSAGRFLVLAGSTAMWNGSPTVKRDRYDRDRLIRTGVLVQHAEMDLLVFARDHEFSSASKAAGVIKDGNASGPQLWIHPVTRQSLKDFLGQ